MLVVLAWFLFSISPVTDASATDRFVEDALRRDDGNAKCTGWLEDWRTYSNRGDYPPRSWLEGHEPYFQRQGCSGLHDAAHYVLSKRPPQANRPRPRPSPPVTVEPARREVTPPPPPRRAPEDIPPEITALPPSPPPPENLAICAGDGVGWLQVTRHPDGRLGYKGRAPQTPSRPAGEIPERDDVVDFPDARPGLIHRDPAPCLLEYEAGCDSEPIRGRYVVASRTRFAVDIGGREQWQLCLMPE